MGGAGGGSGPGAGGGSGAAQRPPRALIVSMSLRPGIPWRVALQQSPPPLPRLRAVCTRTGLSATLLQSTVRCPQLRCLTPGVHTSSFHRGSRDRHHNSAEVSMIQYFTFSSNRGTVTLTLAARTAVSHRARVIDSAGAQEGRPPRSEGFPFVRGPRDRFPIPGSRDNKSSKRRAHNNIHPPAPANPTHLR